ncbi:MAG: aminotransferase class I/II-fold pyridoxal phosphate-dependent enzyme [Flammeovirgaceae bacterium]|jgi:threonine aldolase|nr:aminotransferase class I/II-fold pyridoxal phosphate-dependent enzyme [Flammeovirgaceae bacterium]|tara:strand:- start:8527 stop:9543 length:1017 start_codon:yes stop_codon:yes gene_type:complete
MIDLRSDTITRPTPEMLEVMFSAQVGDDVFEDDPSVNALQEKIAVLFGMEAALFCPSGTMTNQIAMRINTVPQDEVICDQYAHIYLYEGGGMMSNSMISPKLLPGDKGRLSAEMIADSINPEDVHRPRTSLVALENTMNKGGGAIYDFNEIQKISQVCREHGLKLHLDGARLFNALAETKETPSDYGQIFDTISICFSKGLGAPIGSALLGTNKAIKQAKRVRKALGGGMRQAGYLAAACIYSLDHHIIRLAEDHHRAKMLGLIIQNLDYVLKVYPIQTNIIIFELQPGVNPIELLEKLKAKGLLAIGFGKGMLRLVTHLDFDDESLEKAIAIFKSIA